MLACPMEPTHVSDIVLTLDRSTAHLFSLNSLQWPILIVQNECDILKKTSHWNQTPTIPRDEILTCLLQF